MWRKGIRNRSLEGVEVLWCCRSKMLFIRAMAGKEWRYVIYACTVAHYNFLYNPLYITIHTWVGGTYPK